MIWVYLSIVSLCGFMIQIHKDDEVILNFNEVSIPTKILIIAVFCWFMIIIFTNDFFKNPITTQSFLLFMETVWLIGGVAVFLGWILLENILKRPIKFAKSNSAKKKLIYSFRIIGSIVVFVYLVMRFY